MGPRTRLALTKAAKSEGQTCVEGLLKLPKQVTLAREVLALAGKTGKDITADSLMLLRPAQIASLGGSFRSAMTDTTRARYEKLRTNEERRAWLAQYVIDPQTATCEGIACTDASQRTRNWAGQAGPRRQFSEGRST